MRVPVAVLIALIFLMIYAVPALAAYFVGTRENDEIVGTANNDQIYGLRGDDVIRGRGGADYIEGGTGDDRLVGGTGADELYGGKGADELFGQGGNDYINSADNGTADDVNCGDGAEDSVFADTEDKVAPNCEERTPTPAPTP